AIRENASGERSMIRPPNGPRSLITTATDLPLARLVTVTRVPKGSQGLAAVSPEWSYQEASPTRCWAAPAGTGGTPTTRRSATGWPVTRCDSRRRLTSFPSSTRTRYVRTTVPIRPVWRTWPFPTGTFEEYVV